MENRRNNPNPVDSPGYPWKLFWLLVVACLLGIARGVEICGIEAAMLAHFSSDFIAHVLGPMILR